MQYSKTCDWLMQMPSIVCNTGARIVGATNPCGFRMTVVLNALLYDLPAISKRLYVSHNQAEPVCIKMKQLSQWPNYWKLGFLCGDVFCARDKEPLGKTVQFQILVENVPFEILLQSWVLWTAKNRTLNNTCDHKIFFIIIAEIKLNAIKSTHLKIPWVCHFLNIVLPCYFHSLIFVLMFGTFLKTFLNLSSW